MHVAGVSLNPAPPFSTLIENRIFTLSSATSVNDLSRQAVADPRWVERTGC